jgi:hypothetical protein
MFFGKLLIAMALATPMTSLVIPVAFKTIEGDLVPFDTVVYTPITEVGVIFFRSKTPTLFIHGSMLD